MEFESKDLQTFISETLSSIKESVGSIEGYVMPREIAFDLAVINTK